MPGLALNKRTDREPGFTLVEVMTAVTILAIMAAVTFTVVFGAVKRSRSLDRELELRMEATGIGNLITEDLRGAFVQEGVEPYFNGEDVFNRDDPADGISLMTTSVLPVDPAVPAGAVGEVAYSVREGVSGGLVLFRREQMPAEPPHDEGGETFEITDRIISLDLTYSDGEDWFDQWDSQDTTSELTLGKLPREVRIELVLGDEESEASFRTVVSPVMAVGR